MLSDSVCDAGVPGFIAMLFPSSVVRHPDLWRDCQNPQKTAQGAAPLIKL